MSEHSKKMPRGFRAAFKRAKKLAEDADQTGRMLKDAEQKAATQGQRLKEISSDLYALFRLVGSWVRGDYKRVSAQTIFFAIAAIIYFVNPFDVVHDYFPVIGYLDDMTVVGFVIRSIKHDIQEFLVWEKHS